MCGVALLHVLSARKAIFLARMRFFIRAISRLAEMQRTGKGTMRQTFQTALVAQSPKSIPGAIESLRSKEKTKLWIPSIFTTFHLRIGGNSLHAGDAS